MKRLGLACAALSLASCAGEGIPDPVGRAPACDDVAPFRPQLHCIQQFVFTPGCALTGCHGELFPSLDMVLEQGRSHAALVGVPSAELAGVLRVAPGDPDASYLIQKLEGDPSILGDRMPQGGPFLSQAEIDVVRQWILEGAEDD